MTFPGAVRVLMSAAARDVAGTSCGIRQELTEERRETVREAWIVAFRRINKRDPDHSDLWNAGL